jgi:hypothetical protein
MEGRGPSAPPAIQPERDLGDPGSNVAWAPPISRMPVLPIFYGHWAAADFVDAAIERSLLRAATGWFGSATVDHVRR